jgi:quercetin dioxygenase-like cupin family protein
MIWIILVGYKEDKMESVQLLKNLVFQDKGPIALPVHVDPNGRAILFTLKPGQSIREHNVPSSPFFVVILKGRGVFTGGDGVEQTFGPDTLLIFDTGEVHSVQASDELVFIGFLGGAPGAGQ